MGVKERIKYRQNVDKFFVRQNMQNRAVNLCLFIVSTFSFSTN